MWTIRFWRDALERSVKTFAQALLGVLTAGWAGLLDVPWGDALGVAALAAIISLLTSLVSGLVPTRDRVATPSLVPVLPAPRQPIESIKENRTEP